MPVNVFSTPSLSVYFSVYVFAEAPVVEFNAVFELEPYAYFFASKVRVNCGVTVVPTSTLFESYVIPHVSLFEDALAGKDSSPLKIMSMTSVRDLPLEFNVCTVFAVCDTFPTPVQAPAFVML